MDRPAARAFDLTRYDSLPAALADATLQYRSNPFLVLSNRGRVSWQLDYEEFRCQAARFTSALHKNGVTLGDRVAIAANNGPAWLIAAYGAFQLGAVLVPLDARLDGEGLAGLLRHAAPRVLLADTPVWRRIQNTELPPLLVVVRDPELRPVQGATAWEEFLRQGDGAHAQTQAPPGLTRETPAAIVYSSGTSGRPKGCVLSHGNYLSQMEVLGNLYPLEENDVFLSLLPTNHAIDFMCGFLVPILCGARVVHLETLRPEWILQACQDHGVTHMAAVPLILEAFARRLREKLDQLTGAPAAGMRGLKRLNTWLTRKRPSHLVSRTLLKPIHDQFGGRLRRIFAGGAFVPAETARFFYQLGFPVAIGYGLSEACAVLTVNDLHPFRPDTVGRPVPGCEVRLEGRDERGVGEVWVRGPQVFQGYLDDPELTSEVLSGGWLATGDLGLLDAAGHLRLLGRRKNMVVTAGGKNVYPEEVEEAFATLPVEETAVVAAHTVWPTLPGQDEALILVIRLKEGQELGPLLEEVRSADRRQADYRRLGGVLVSEAPFPRTTSLKLKRHLLGQQLAELHRREEVLTLGVAVGHE